MNGIIDGCTKNGITYVKDVRNPYKCLLKNNNFSIKTTND